MSGEDTTCHLCSSTSAAVNNEVVMCFATTGPSTVHTDVADVLNKHFWFELHSGRDAQAFVCRPCWHKVDAFHRFYESVLVLYEARSCQLPKPEKCELSADEADDVDIVPSCDVYDDDDVIKQEATDNADDTFHPRDSLETTPTITTIPKRKRGRPRKNDPNTRSGGAQQPSIFEHISVVAAGVDEADDDDDEDAVKVEPLQPAADEVRELKRNPIAEESTTDRLLAEYFTLQCDVCAVPLPNLEVARVHHQQVHKKRGYLQCGCGRRFVRNATILEHCAFHADPSPWKCMECCKIYASCSRLSSHRTLKHSVKSTTTEKTAAAAERSQQSGVAAKRCDDDDDALLRRFAAMFCGVCGVAYGTFSEARAHYKSAHGQPGYVECCGKRFAKKCRAVQHCEWHANPRQFDCPICARNFTGSTALRNHTIRRHSSNAPFCYQCDQCAASFQLIAQLRYHEQRMHLSPDAKRFECYRCHRRYVYVSQLRHHMRDAHDAAPSHVCDVCARCFKSKSAYELHHAQQHGSVPLLKCQCPECGKWLKHAGMLSRHMFQHRSVPQTCADCGHVSPGRRALYVHRRLVHREPTHKCLVCGKMFKKLLTLREHMAIHAGITDLYTCAYCAKTFRSISNMYKHRRQVHAEQYAIDRRTTAEREAAEATAAVQAARAARFN